MATAFGSLDEGCRFDVGFRGFAGYATTMILSYIVGQKKYPINYPMKEILTYVLITVLLYFCMTAANAHLPLWLALTVNTLLGLLFIAYIVKKDFPLAGLPVIGKHL